jgi:hypothetical protein
MTSTSAFATRGDEELRRDVWPLVAAVLLLGLVGSLGMLGLLG